SSSAITIRNGFISVLTLALCKTLIVLQGKPKFRTRAADSLRSQRPAIFQHKASAQILFHQGPDDPQSQRGAVFPCPHGIEILAQSHAAVLHHDARLPRFRADANLDLAVSP